MPEDSKEELEKKKLYWEIVQASRRWYEQPEKWVSIASVLAALVGIGGQFIVSELKSQIARKEVQIAALEKKEAESDRDAALKQAEQLKDEVKKVNQLKGVAEADTKAAKARYTLAKSELDSINLEFKQKARLSQSIGNIESARGQLVFNQEQVVVGVKFVTLDDSTLERLREDLANFSGLSELSLDNTQVSDRGVLQLVGLSNLRKVSLANTRIRDEGLTSMGKLIHLVELVLTGTQVGDEGLLQLEGLKSLKRLYLGDTRVSNAGLARLRSIGELVEIELDGSQITATSVEHLKGLPRLLALKLTGSKSTDETLALLKPLASLNELYVQGTAITKEDTTDVKKVLTKLTIHGLEEVAGYSLASPLRSPSTSEVNRDGARTYTKLWRNSSVIRVRFLEGTPEQRDKVARIAEQWTEYANLRFDFGSTDADAEVRVAFRPQGGSWSGIGTDNLSMPRAEPTMNLGWVGKTSKDEDRFAILHEFGHVLGLIHEHQNPHANIPWKRDAVYRAMEGPPNFWTRELVNVNIFKKFDEMELPSYREFDPESVMLYFFNTKFTGGDFVFPHGMTLSRLDREFVGILYPFQGPIVHLTSGQPPLRGEVTESRPVGRYSFYVPASGRWIVEAEASEPVVLSLRGPNSRIEVLTTGPKIDHELEKGLYYVWVRTKRPRGGGAYTISLQNR
jgi:hypothetical protein